MSRQQVTCLYSNGGQYYEALCHLLVSHLQETLGDHYAYRVTSEPMPGEELGGAMDILDVIASAPSVQPDAGEVFLGFSQSDVAYYFRFGGHPLYPTPHRSQGNVVSLGKLYPEYLHIYSQGPGAPSGLEQTLPWWDTLYMGAVGSGTLITALNVLHLLHDESLQGGVGLRQVRQFYWQQSPEGYKDQDIPEWGGMLVSGPGYPDLADRLKGGQGHLVALSKAEGRHLSNAFSQFYDVNPLQGYPGPPVLAVEVPSLLVSSQHLPPEVAETTLGFIENLDRGEQAALAFLQDKLLGVPPHLKAGMTFLNEASLQTFAETLREYTGKRRDSLILSPHRTYLRRRQDGGAWEIGIAILAILGAFALSRQALRTLPSDGSLLDLSPALTGAIALLFFVFWLHLSLFVVWRLELTHYLSYKTDAISPFIDSSYLELFPMVLQYIASAFSADKLFPSNQLAQMFWLSIPLLVVVSTLFGFVHVALPPLLNYIKNHLDEEDTMELQDHFVICNWNVHSEQIIRQLRMQDKMAGRRDPEILVLIRREELVTLPKLGVQRSSDLPEHTVFALPPSRVVEESEGIMKVVAVIGEPQDEMVLRMTHPERARAVIVFPDPEQPQPDSATVLTLLKLQEILQEDSTVQVIVWCDDSRNVSLFLDPRFRLSDVCSTEWAWRVICQATRVSHVSNIYRHLLTSSADTNEFYEYCLPEEWPGGKFQHLQQAIAQFNAHQSETVPGCCNTRNTILLVGYFTVEDEQRKEPRLNPDPEEYLDPGDCLLFLTYVFDTAMKEKLDDFLVTSLTQ